MADPIRPEMVPPSEEGERQASSFPVVGIGASAGGLAAFTQFLSHLPEQTGMAFVLVQHLDPVHESQLTDLLSKATRLPVTEVTDGMAVEPDHVYIIPPNVSMAIEKGVLRLTPRGQAQNPHLPVDFFFRSLAEDQQSRAIGVVLSGTGSDGSLGLAEIKAAGGITFVQDDDSAEYASMPQSAVAGGCVDFVLPPDRIARELAQIGQHPYLHPTPTSQNEPEAEGDFEKIVGRLRTVTGVDFSEYRPTTIKRRIARRMALHKQESLSDYMRFLQANPAEIQALYRDMLINVTSFFRDPEVFEALKTTVFPEIIKGKTPENPVRIWVPGCSTGQEAYSLAMAMLEFLDQKATSPAIQIFGTDINDEAAVEKARPGIYPPGIEAELSPGRLQRFFTKVEGGYRIGKAIRDMCVFARQDVTADPPFSHLDLISCRNVLIYLSPALQQRIIPTFHYALNPGGFLLLGPSEAVGKFSDLFDKADRKHNIYSRTAALSRPYPYLVSGRYPPPTPARGAAPAERVQDLDMRKESDRVILSRFAPAAVLIDENLEILQFRGQTAPYLQSPSGQATHNILKMARVSLFLELRSVIDEARKKNATARRDNVRVQDEGEARLVNLEVAPIRRAGSAQRCFLVLFTEALAPAAAPAPSGAAALSHGAQETPAEARDDSQLRRENAELRQENAQLQQELASVKEYLQAIIEQQNAANEELQSANEEIRSANEELQTNNEEMQTAREELQSTNEELGTVNDELQARNQEMTRLSDDLTNTLSSMKLPIVMLGSDLRIRRFTPAAATLLNLIATDVGRPFADIKSPFDIPDQGAMLLDVIATVAAKEQEVQDRTGRWYSMVMHPYRTDDNRIDGVVLVLHDLTDRKRTEETRAALAAIVESSEDAIISKRLDGTVASWNAGAEHLFGYRAEEMIGQPVTCIVPAELLSEEASILVRLRRGESIDHLETVRLAKDGRRILVSLTISPIRDRSGAIVGASKIARDITERKRAEEKLAAAQRQVQSIIDNTTAVIYAFDLEERFVLANTPLARLLNSTPEQMIGRRRHEFMPREDADWHEANDRKVIEAGKALEFEEYSQLQGRTITWLTTKFPLCDEQGRIYAVAGISADVSERKQAEKALAANLDAMKRLQQIGARFVKAGELADVLGEVVEAAIAITHADMGNIQLVEEQSGCLRIAAHRGFEQSYLDFWNSVAEGRGACGTAMRDAQRTIVEDVAQSPIFVGTPALEVQRAAGVGAVQSTPLFGRSGDLIGMLSTHWHVPHRPDESQLQLLDLLAQQAADTIEFSQNEQALRQSEERFRVAQELSPDGFTILRPVRDAEGHVVDFTFVYQNATIARISGTDPKAVVGRRLLELFPGHAGTQFLKAYQHVTETGESCVFEDEYGGETTVRPTWFRIAVVPIGEDIAILAQDITDRKLTEEELHAAKLSAEQASGAKDHFLAVLSHELRTPLTPVLATVAMLQQTACVDADTREQLEVIRRNAEMEARLIDDLLDVTRITKGKVELEKHPVELNTILRNAVEVCRPDIDSRKVEFGLDIKDGPYVVNADAGRLQQVFWNLLRNAIKFTPHGGCVGMRCGKDVQGQVMVEVSDSGVGIKPELIGSLFKAFEQGGADTTRQFGGLGLGLAISRGLIEMHGGSIEARSDGEGKGATFRVRLPLHQGQETGGRGREDGKDAAALRVEATAPVPPLRILLVEDHGDTVRIMKRLLVGSGHEVEIGGDIETALELAGSQAFDLLISDLGLPDGSGVDLMRELRKRGWTVPGIALSGFGQEEDILRTKEAGFAAHLTKPTSPARLAEAIAVITRTTSTPPPPPSARTRYLGEER